MSIPNAFIPFRSDDSAKKKKETKKRSQYPSHAPAVSKYDKNNYDKLLLRFRKDGNGERGYNVTKELLTEMASRRNMSANEYVLQALHASFVRDDSKKHMIFGGSEITREQYRDIDYILGGKNSNLMIIQGDLVDYFQENIYNAVKKGLPESETLDDYHFLEYVAKAVAEKKEREGIKAKEIW